jgi:hypothetical protein
LGRFQAPARNTFFGPDSKNELQQGPELYAPVARALGGSKLYDLVGVIRKIELVVKGIWIAKGGVRQPDRYANHK